MTTWIPESIQFARLAPLRPRPSWYGSLPRAYLLSALPQEPGCRDLWSKGIEPTCYAASLPSSAACLQAAPGSACFSLGSTPPWRSGITKAAATACAIHTAPCGQEPTDSTRHSGGGGPPGDLSSPRTMRRSHQPTPRARSCLAPTRNRRVSRCKTCRRWMRLPRLRQACGHHPCRSHRHKDHRLRSRVKPLRRKTTTSSVCVPRRMILIHGCERLPAGHGKSVADRRPCGSFPNGLQETLTSGFASARSGGLVSYAIRRQLPRSCGCSTTPILPSSSVSAWRSAAAPVSRWEIIPSNGGSGQRSQTRRSDAFEPRGTTLQAERKPLTPRL